MFYPQNLFFLADALSKSDLSLYLNCILRWFPGYQSGHIQM